MKRLAIIPARKGSKRIPNKNVKDFCGKPMISHAVKACADAAIFDEIHISTDSTEISSIATACGHPPAFSRPENLSGDHATMMEVVKYVVETFERSGHLFDTVALVYATSPLIASGDLVKACQDFEASDRKNPVLAVTAFPAPIEHAFRIVDGSILVPDNEKSLALRTQDLQTAYYDAGMFALYSSAYIKQQIAAGNFSAFRAHVVPSYRVTDIDWPEDWERAEMLYKAVNGIAK